MHEIVMTLLSYKEFVILLGVSTVVASSAASGALAMWVKHRIEAAEDEREERQALARKDLRHRQQLEKLDKLETVASIVIADESLAKGIRSKIDEVYPKVRVEQDWANQEEETDRMERLAGKKRSKRR
jgi:7-keto-8-aminopelargonate synthetase-like enzyme